MEFPEALLSKTKSPIIGLMEELIDLPSLKRYTNFSNLGNEFRNSDMEIHDRLTICGLKKGKISKLTITLSGNKNTYDIETFDENEKSLKKYENISSTALYTDVRVILI
jgi:hypothetical protein